MTNLNQIRTALETAQTELRQVRDGHRGYVSLPVTARRTGIRKETLRMMAEKLGLEIKNSGGSYGFCAYRPE